VIPYAEARMIKLTRLGGEEFVLNADLIRYIEARPDTFITLTIGDRVVVEESMDEVLRRAIEYQRAKHAIPDVRADARGGRAESRSWTSAPPY
jgi:flagellar protein FlbD